MSSITSFFPQIALVHFFFFFLMCVTALTRSWPGKLFESRVSFPIPWQKLNQCLLSEALPFHERLGILTVTYAVNQLTQKPLSYLWARHLTRSKILNLQGRRGIASKGSPEDAGHRAVTYFRRDVSPPRRDWVVGGGSRLVVFSAFSGGGRFEAL